MITLIIKCTDGCNLRCKYCSVGKKKEAYNMIDIDTLKKCGDYIVEIAELKKEKDIKIILHGGEPTLIKSNVFKSFFDYLNLTYNAYSFKFAIQTNGLKLSDEMLQLFKDYNVGVGVSVDGSEKIHNDIRITSAGNGCYNVVTENILRIKNKGINVSGLIVVTKPLIEENLSYLNFFNYHNIDLKINPLLNYGEAKEASTLWLKPGEYARYIISIYKYMLRNDIEIDIKPISDIFHAITNDVPMRECAYKKNCQDSFVCVDYRGNIYPCGRFYDVGIKCIGNIIKYDENNEKAMHYMKDNYSEECCKCKYLKWCYGGCRAYREIINMNKTPLCYDVKCIFDYFCNDGILEYIEYLNNKKDYLNRKLNDMEKENV